MEGTSILDVPRLDLNTMEEATDFIKAYGFDPGNDADLELLWSFFDSSIQFIERTLAHPDYPKVPEHLKNRESLTDLRRLLLICPDVSHSASATGHRERPAVFRSLGRLGRVHGGDGGAQRCGD